MKTQNPARAIKKNTKRLRRLIGAIGEEIARLSCDNTLSHVTGAPAMKSLAKQLVHASERFSIETNEKHVSVF